MMELYQLRTFVTVMEESSISGAARRLSITPSSVSTHIKTLETEFGVELFVRTNQGVEVTDKGQILAQHARQTLQAATGLSQQANALQQHLIGTVKLGISVSSGVFNIPDFFKRLNTTYPDIQLELTQSETASILHQLRYDALDIGIIYGDLDDDLLTVHPLFLAELVVAIPKAWSNDVDKSWESLATVPWIHTGADCQFQLIIDSLHQQHNIKPKQFIRSNDDRTRLDLVRAEVVASILEKTEATHPDIAILDTEPMTCAVSLVFQGYRKFDPLLQAVSKLILSTD
jgi:DNA-binding transcriptional LysR family regulator